MADALTQIVEKLEENSNILVTVNTNPTVDLFPEIAGPSLIPIHGTRKKIYSDRHGKT